MIIFNIDYRQYCDTFQDLYEIFHVNHLFYVLTFIDLDELHCIVHIRRGFLSIDYFIEKYFTDHSSVFLVCALITLSHSYTFHFQSFFKLILMIKLPAYSQFTF